MNGASDTKALRAEVLRLSQRVDEHAAEVLSQQVSYQHEGHRIALLALSVRMLQTYRAVFILVKEGLHDGAAAVLRTMVEQHFVFTALFHDPALLLKAEMEEQGDQRKALKALRSLAPDARPDNLTEAVLDAEIEGRSETAFAAFVWAQRAGLEDMFQTLYRHLSFNAHGALHAINDYLVTGGDGMVVGVRSRILPERSIDFVLVAIGIMLAAERSMDGQPLTEVRKARRECLGSELEALRERYYLIADKLYSSGADGVSVS